MSNVPVGVSQVQQSSPTLQQIVASSSPNGSPSIDKSKASNKARKPRKRWVGQQLEKLENLFKINQNPKAEDLDQLANELQSQVSDVKTWFQNRRAKEKKRGSPSGEVDITTIDATKVTMHVDNGGSSMASPHLQTLTHTTIEHNIDPQQHQHHQPQHHHHQHLPGQSQHQLQHPQPNLPPPQHLSQHSQHHHSQHQHPQHQHLQQQHLLQHAQHPIHQSSQAMQHQPAQHHQHHHQLQSSPQAIHQHLSPSQQHQTLQHQQSHPQSMQHQSIQQPQSHLQQSDSLEACPSCSPYIDKLNQRIKELEEQCHGYQMQMYSSPLPPGPPPPIPPIPSPKRDRDPGAGELFDESADKKLKRSLEPQRLFKKWANQVTRKIKGAKFFEAFGVPTAPVIIEEACTKEMFDACFETKGRLIQPTPDNKPYSTVTIRRYEGFEEVQDLFGEGNIVHAGHPAWVWRRNTVNTRSGEPRDVKLHRRTATIDSLEVHYNRNTMRLQLTFTCTLTPDTVPPNPPKTLPAFLGQPSADHPHIPNTLPLPHSRLGLHFLPPSLRNLAPNLTTSARVDPIPNVQIDRTLINSINESLRMSGDPNDPHAPPLSSSLPTTLSHPHSLSPLNLQHSATLHSSLQNLPHHNHMPGSLQVPPNLQNNLPPHSMQNLPSNINMNSLSPHLTSSSSSL